MGYIKIKEGELYYEIYGKGNNLALLNGIFMTTQSFYPLLQILNKKYRVLLFDFRGQGKSSKKGEKFSLKMHSDDFYQILKELNIKKINIVGVSYGGEVALRFALDYPDLVKSLIIVTSTSEVDDEMKEKIERWKKGAESKDQLTFINSWLRDVYSDDFLNKYESFLFDKLKKALEDFDYDSSIKLMDSFLELYNNPLTEDLKKIRAKSLIIAGERDFLKPVEFSKKIHENIENSEFFVIRDSGHALVVEKKEELTTLILGFLEKINLSERR